MTCRPHMRRKGEQKVQRRWPPYDDKHPVAHRISTGDNWFYAWMAEAAPLVVLERRSGIAFQRLLAIDLYDIVTRAELEALAGAWEVPLDDVLASIPDPQMVIDQSRWEATRRPRRSPRPHHGIRRVIFRYGGGDSLAGSQRSPEAFLPVMLMADVINFLCSSPCMPAQPIVGRESLTAFRQSLCMARNSSAVHECFPWSKMILNALRKVSSRSSMPCLRCRQLRIATRKTSMPPGSAHLSYCCAACPLKRESFS